MRPKAKSFRWMAGEFLLIVLGVLTALAVDRWTDYRSDRELEAEYLARLRVDLEAAEDGLLRDYYSGVRAHAAATLEHLESSVAPSDTAALVVAAYHAHRMLTPRVPNATYQELLATGNLRVIRDRSLVRELADMHSEAAFWRLAFDPADQDPEFNRAVRGKIPPRLQFSIAEQCPIEGQPFECHPDLQGWDPADFVRWLVEDPTSREALTRRARDVMRIASVLGGLSIQVESLLARLD